VTAPPSAPHSWPEPRVVLTVTLITTAVVTLVSHLAPDDYANTIVGALFLGATWLLVLRRDTAVVRAYGMSLGGLTEPVKLEAARLLREGGAALGWCLLLMAIVFPPFWYGYGIYWNVGELHLALPDDALSRVLGQVLVIALPEEAFFRGYLQSALDGAWSAKRWRILGAELGPGWLLSAAIFAVGHLLTIPHVSRLAVFFPALLFGWLRARTNGVGAGILFHAACNLFSAFLAESYGLG
jgi:hypothetical protein